MAKPDLLSQLRDVHLPPEVDWWPLAIGWWVLIALSLLSLIVLIVRYRRLSFKTRYSRMALIELKELQNKYDKNWLVQLDVLLKRSSLAHFQKNTVASLTEQQWIDFLLSTGSLTNGENIWTDDSLRLLKDGVFRQSNSIDREQQEILFKQSKIWLEQLPKREHRHV